MKGSQRVPDRFVGFMTFSSSASARVMREIQDILQHIYKHYHYSPKALREVRLIADALEESW
jgi:hypothetical protein